MKIKIMYNGIKCDKILISGMFYKKNDGGYNFIAKRSIRLQLKDKLKLESYQEADALLEEMQIIFGATIKNDSDAMRDYFEDDSIYFAPDNPFYNKIDTVITEKFNRNAPTTSTEAPDEPKSPEAEEK